MIVALTAVFGALIGSFLNVVIYRVPAKRSVVSPPSACGSCGSQIRPWDNIPVLSWLVLRGRCRDCGAGISARYPLVELGTAVFFGLVAWWVLSERQAPVVGQVLTISTASEVVTTVMLVAFLYLAAISVSLAMIDIDTRKLPNAIVLPAYPVGGILLVGTAVLMGEPGRIMTVLVGAAGMFAFYFVLALVYPGGMGFGDVKLAGVLGLYLGWLGWGALAVGTFAAFLLGGLFALVLLIAGRATRKSSIPFGPWMLVGAWVGIFAGNSLAADYLSLFGLA